jgi:hypothetical protein
MGLLQYAIAFTFTASSSQLLRSWYPVTGLGWYQKIILFCDDFFAPFRQSVE